MRWVACISHWSKTPSIPACFRSLLHRRQPTQFLRLVLPVPKTRSDNLTRTRKKPHPDVITDGHGQQSHGSEKIIVEIRASLLRDREMVLAPTRPSAMLYSGYSESSDCLDTYLSKVFIRQSTGTYREGRVSLLIPTYLSP